MHRYMHKIGDVFRGFRAGVQRGFSRFLLYGGLVLLTVGVATALVSRTIRPKFTALEAVELSQDLVDAGAVRILDLLEEAGGDELQNVLSKSLNISAGELRKFQRKLRPYVFAERAGLIAAAVGAVMILIYGASTLSLTQLLGKREFTPPALAFDTTRNPEHLRLTVVAMHERAHGLRLQSQVFLLLIVLVCSGGFALFYYAGAIASREYDQELSGFLEDAREDIDERIDGLNRGFEDITDALRYGEIDAQTAAAMMSVDREQFSLNVAAMKDVPMQVGLKMIENNDRLISSTAMRAGTIIVLIMLVKVFVSAYKYNQRLAGFYSARADVLTLSATEYPSDFDQLVRSLSPDGLEFEQMTDDLLGRLAQSVQQLQK